VSWIEVRLGRPATADDLSAGVLQASERGRRVTAGRERQAGARISEAAVEAAGWAREVDGLLLPVLAAPPWPIGEDVPDPALPGLVCSLANFSGQPAVAVPTVQGGLPVGVQIQGPVGSDEQLLDLVEGAWPLAPVPPPGSGSWAPADGAGEAR
jgi:Asp-tRNA(Asn)/Glu-tRNA(Gln) amidotransferase A subunit family amidase